MKYQIVTNNARESETFEAAADMIAALKARGFSFNGYHSSEGTRKELQGQPKFNGLCGPMWNGTDENGKPVIRYEDWASYEILSL